MHYETFQTLMTALAEAEQNLAEFDKPFRGCVSRDAVELPQAVLRDSYAAIRELRYAVKVACDTAETPAQVS